MQLDTGFEAFPPEILFMIVSHLPDLESLTALIWASPSVSRFFDTYGLDVVEDLLNSTVLLDEQIKTVIRTIAHIRTGQFPISSLEEFQDRVTCEAIKHRAPADYAFVPRALPHASPGVLRGLLVTAQRNSSLASNFLQYYLDRFRRLQPSHTKDSGYRMARQSFSLLRAMNPPTVPCTLQDAAPPSYLEEQRVLRAFWRIQLILDLNTALANGIITGWSTDEIEELRSMDYEDVYRLPEIWKVFNEDDQFPVDSDLSFGMHFVEPHEFSLIVMATEYLNECPAKPLLSSKSKPFSAAQPEDNESELMMMHHCPNFEALSLDFSTHLLEEVLLDSYRNLGFAIWDQKRMETYEVDPDNYERTNDARLVWRMTILPDEDRAKAELWEREHFSRLIYYWSLDWGVETEVKRARRALKKRIAYRDPDEIAEAEQKEIDVVAELVDRLEALQVALYVREPQDIGPPNIGPPNARPG